MSRELFITSLKQMYLVAEDSPIDPDVRRGLHEEYNWNELTIVELV